MTAGSAEFVTDNKCEDGLEWFVLRVTYQRELKAKQLFDDEGIDCFIPMEVKKKRDRMGRFCRVEEPAIHNYIFVHATKERIGELKLSKMPMLRYVMKKEGGGTKILTVPDSQMRNFIAVSGNAYEQAQYLEPTMVNLKRGDRVKVVGGIWEGVEGTYMRINDARGRRVVILIEGIAAVATTCIHASLVEKIE